MTSSRFPAGRRSGSRSVQRILKIAMSAGVAIVTLASPSYADTLAPRRIVEAADIGSPVISPDGRSVAFRLEQASVERNTYDTSWYVQDLDGTSPPRRIADGGVPLRSFAGGALLEPAVWSPDGQWVYFRALVNGEIDVWRAAVNGAVAEPVTRDPADVREFSLSADGRTLTYSVGASRDEVIAAEQAEYDRGIHIEEASPIGQSLFRSGYVEGRLATQRYSGSWFERVALLADAPSRWQVIDMATRERRGLAPAGQPAPLQAASELMPEAWTIARDLNTDRIALLTRVGDVTDGPAATSVELVMLPSQRARRPVRCRAELCVDKAISGIQWRPNSDEVLFTVTDPQEGRAQSIFRWNVRTGAVRPVVRSDGLIDGGGPYQLGSCGLSADALACVAAEADLPPRLERVDIETGRRQVLFEPNASLAHDLSTRTPSRLIRWKNADGQAFTGQFFPARRTGDSLPPLFVTYYTCSGFLRGGLGDEWPLASLADSGISALCINHNGDYSSDRIQVYDQGLSAIESAVELLAAEGEIDRANVGMGGLSFGTAMTLWTVIESDLLTAASVTSPVVSPNYYLLNSMKGKDFFDELRRTWGLGAPDETPERWRSLSPVFNLDRIRAPILMQMPEQEYLHSLDYAIPLIRNQRADLYVFPHEPHIKFQPRHKLHAYERNVDWFRFWLQGVEDPDPGKLVQYERWRRMRSALHAESDR